MANINTPAHDFAPPWLKIPTYDSARPSGAEGDRGRHSSRKEEHSSASVRLNKDSGNFAPQRQHFYNDSRRERSNFSSERKPSSHHHSLDFEDTYLDGNSSQGTYLTNNTCNGTCNSSQSALLRRPHSRHDFRNIPASYAKGELYNRHTTNNGGSLYGKIKSKFSDATNSNSIFDENGGGISVSSNNFNQEFPSLQGDISEEPTLPAVNGSVWEKPRNMTLHSGGMNKKIQLIKKPFNSEAIPENSKKSLTTNPLVLPSSSCVASSCSNMNPHNVIVTSVAKGGSGIYRALVPTKNNNIIIKKPLTAKDATSKAQSALKKISSVNNSAHSMEILVKHPKAPGNKSEFLKALRNENRDSSTKLNQDVQNNSSQEFGNCKSNVEERPHTNGIDIAKMSIDDDDDEEEEEEEDEDGEKPLLSSSLEAEQRLLKEMGWKEDASDDDNCAPLTEDEMREFRALTEQIQKNGLRRGLPTSFSPRRLAPFPKVPLPVDTSSSSSESDSDF